MSRNFQGFFVTIFYSMQSCINFALLNPGYFSTPINTLQLSPACSKLCGNSDRALVLHLSEMGAGFNVG